MLKLFSGSLRMVDLLNAGFDSDKNETHFSLLKSVFCFFEQLFMMRFPWEDTLLCWFWRGVVKLFCCLANSSSTRCLRVGFMLVPSWSRLDRSLAGPPMQLVRVCVYRWKEKVCITAGIFG